MNKLTHFGAQGQAHMVDVAAKDETHRVARAGGHIRMAAATLKLIASGSAYPQGQGRRVDGGFSISGVVDWIAATVIVWVVSLLAVFILPFLGLKKYIEERRD